MMTGFIITASILLVTLVVLYYKSKNKLNLLTRQKAQLSQDLNLYKTGLRSLIALFKDRSEMFQTLKSNVAEHPLGADDIKRIQRQYVGSNSWEHFFNDYEKIGLPWLNKLCDEYSLSLNDKKILIMERLQLTNSDMAAVMNISAHGLKKAKTRLRKKLKSPSS